MLRSEVRRAQGFTFFHVLCSINVAERSEALLLSFFAILFDFLCEVPY